jgi:hypothetical protein
MKAILFGAALALVPAALAAQAAAPERVTHVTIYGRDACPRGQGDEIVICARRPETERYRIPKALRDQPGTDPESTSWAERAQSLEYVGRTGTESCSTVGPGGFTGCWSQMVRAARQERAHPESGNTPP